MILKKQEKDGIVKAMYASQTILGSIYDSNTNTLTIIFSNGGKYSYAGVPESDYKIFETTDSQGKTLNSVIKGKYPFTKLDNIDVNTVNSMKNEIEKLRQNTGKNAVKDDAPSQPIDEKKLIFSMSFIVTEYLSTGKINQDVLKDVKTILTATPKAVLA